MRILCYFCEKNSLVSGILYPSIEELHHYFKFRICLRKVLPGLLGFYV
ncbi:hypothetical protein GWE_00355 [Chlamydia psittaci NJ1]|uniref:Uncharacterized protein n=1 Tax=Chlamydia psittaci 99DC5 TaxID=1112251 RepID=A0ABP2X2S5_CHLPS|nr:hypothetical protein B595_0409 [Chlamydia psittaci 84/55]AFS20477.1 hypothetical protein B598_0388 [Chlamydia psittaci GR9]AFS21977.1 hypothetical protein B599_0384 [Chlamydia psittaci MN]AFS22575.1 hypothetical protein B600_0413 [Chlamydia psittaci VS225]AFS23704.1 hypothetical protein B601_0387 [Chlamydia psittaci WS/RT/E30]AFS25014.1 hypothetical protein B602_0386 [Chlamydia psittaci M56]AFS26236.1 hypothetical protein B603_0391 [Chlamydia psittaci WC]AFS26815.1 hypothetical protein B7